MIIQKDNVEVKRLENIFYEDDGVYPAFTLSKGIIARYYLQESEFQYPLPPQYRPLTINL